MKKNKPTLALVMMVKNEKARIHVTLNSILESGNPIIDCMVIYDTGSTDNTIEIITTFCKKYNILLHLKIGEFTNFSVSRNVLLDFADDKADWNLLLDCNDEVKNSKDLLYFIQNYDTTLGENEKIATAYHVKQLWKSHNSLDEYYNMRLFLTKYGWRYKGVVHEYLDTDNTKTLKKNVQVPEFYIYQDRTQDDDKSSKRFTRDKELLYKDYIENPDNSRTIFYLAQTYSCLHKIDKAYEYSLLRIKKDDFLEEKFHSYYRCGEHSRIMNHNWEESFSWYLQAFQFSCNISKYSRIEPLIRIVEYYKDKDWKLGYFFLKIAMSLEYPSDCILFVDRNMYDYERYHLLGIYVYFVGDIDANIGLQATQKAYDKKKLDVDLNNMNVYKSIIKSREKILHKETLIDKQDKKNGDTYDILKQKADMSYEKIKDKILNVNSLYQNLNKQHIDILNNKKTQNELTKQIESISNTHCLKKLNIKHKQLQKECEIKDTELNKTVNKYKVELNKLLDSWKVCFVWYLKLYSRSLREFKVPNIYPLLLISEFYSKQDIWTMSFYFVQESCALRLPDNYEKNSSLKYQYDYLRWHMLSLSAHKINKNDIGLEACKRAVSANKNSEVDKNNLIHFKKLVKNKINQ